MLGPGKCIYHEHRSPKMLVRPEKSKNIYLYISHMSKGGMYLLSQESWLLLHCSSDIPMLWCWCFPDASPDNRRSPSIPIMPPILPFDPQFSKLKLGYKGWRQKCFFKGKSPNHSCQIVIFSFAWKLSSHEAKADTKTRMDFQSTPFASFPWVCSLCVRRSKTYCILGTNKILPRGWVTASNLAADGSLRTMHCNPEVINYFLGASASWGDILPFLSRMSLLISTPWIG